MLILAIETSGQSGGITLAEANAGSFRVSRRRLPRSWFTRWPRCSRNMDMNPMDHMKLLVASTFILISAPLRGQTVAHANRVCDCYLSNVPDHETK